MYLEALEDIGEPWQDSNIKNKANISRVVLMLALFFKIFLSNKLIKLKLIF